MIRVPRLYSAANSRNSHSSTWKKTKENFIENGCPRSFVLVLLTTQKTLIILVGLQQLIQIERGPAVQSGHETRFN